MQCQIFSCQATYCDFVLWTEKDLHLERIYPDEELWETASSKAEEFFTKGILPELLGKFYSRVEPPATTAGSVSSAPDGTSSAPLFCYCQKPKSTPSEKVIECGNDQCPRKLFHLTCLALKSMPRKGWHCPECRKSRKRKC